MKVVGSQSFHLFHINDDYINEIAFFPLYPNHCSGSSAASSIAPYIRSHDAGVMAMGATAEWSDFAVVVNVDDDDDDDSGDLFLSEWRTHTMEWLRWRMEWGNDGGTNIYI